MILENGIVRTLDPPLPTSRGRSRSPATGSPAASATHETALASPEVVDLGGRSVVPGFSDAHVHFPTWALAQQQVRPRRLPRSLDEALARVRDGRPRAGRRLAPRLRLAERRLGADVEPTRADLDAVTGDAPGGADREGLALALAQLGGARARERRPGGAGRRRRARRARRADRRPARGGGLAVPGPARRPSPTTSTSTRCAAGVRLARVPRRHGRARQGRLARRAAALPAARRRRRLDAARLAVAPARPARRARGLGLRSRRRRRPLCGSAT